MKTRIAMCAVALGAVLVAGGDAYAKGGTKAKPQTVNLTHPSGSADYSAQGTVKVHAGKNGDQTILTLSHLKALTVYEVRDADTGQTLGTVKSDRRGKATFNLTKHLQTKAASVGGSNGSTVNNVDVVDSSTGDTVLTGDVTPPAPVPSEGYDEFSDDKSGASGDVYISTDPDNGDTFEFDFYPAVDPKADPSTVSYSYYSVSLDTSNGDKLPLGASSAADLAGRAFEVHSDADGSVVLSGSLPDLTPIDQSYDDGGDSGNWGGDWSGNWGGDWSGNWGGDWSGNWGGDWGGNWGGDWGGWGGHDCTGNSSGSGSSNDSSGSSSSGATKTHLKSAKKKGKKDGTASTGFTLFIADANGSLQNAESLAAQSYDDGGDNSGDWGGGNWGDYGGWGGNGGWGGGVTIVINLPSNFDPSSFLSQFFNGNFDFSNLFGGSAGSSSDSSGSNAGTSGASKSHKKHKHQ